MLSLLSESIFQWLIRHLQAAFHRHHVRGAVGADLVYRSGAWLCRRGGEQLGDPRRLLILAAVRLFVPYGIEHPLWMLAFLALTAVTFSLFGFLFKLWADGFEKLQIIPLLSVTPSAFLGGSLYSIGMLPAAVAEDRVA